MEHFIDDYSERPDICFVVVLLLTIYFRSHIEEIP